LEVVLAMAGEGEAEMAREAVATAAVEKGTAASAGVATAAEATATAGSEAEERETAKPAAASMAEGTGWRDRLADASRRRGRRGGTRFASRRPSTPSSRLLGRRSSGLRPHTRLRRFQMYRIRRSTR